MEEGARKSGLISRYKRSSLLKNNNDKNNIYSLENFENIPNKNNSFTILKSNSIGVKIYLIKNKINNKQYIKKEIDLKIIPNYLNLIKKNIIFYKKNFLKSNSSILNLCNSHKTKDKIILIYDYIKEGNLKDYLIKNGPFSEENVFLIFYQILITVKYFHNKGYFFNNLNIDNILLGENFRVYLYNFTEYVNINEGGDNMNLFYSNNEDLFCLGIILYQLSHNFSNNDYNNIDNDNFVSDNLKKLIDNLILSEINNIDEIFNQKWMKIFMENPNQIIISRFRDFTKEKSSKYNNNKNDDNNDTYLNKNNSYIHLHTQSSTNEFDFDSILNQNNDSYIYDKKDNNNDYENIKIHYKKINNKNKNINYNNSNNNKIKKIRNSFEENDEYKKSIFLQRVESERNIFNNDKQNSFIDSIGFNKYNNEEFNYNKKKKPNLRQPKSFWDKFSDFFVGEISICKSSK